MDGIKPGDTRLVLDPSKLRYLWVKLIAKSTTAVDCSEIDAIYYNTKYKSIKAKTNPEETLKYQIMIKEEQTTMEKYPRRELKCTARDLFRKLRVF